jgi:hypothetical protein
MKLTITIVRTAIAAGSIIIYFKRRKLYVDDKCYKIKILPKKKISIYRKDIVNIIGIIGSTTLCVSIGEKVYFFVKEHDITLKISKRLPSKNVIDIEAISSPESVDIVSASDSKVLKPKKKLPIRDMVWIGVALAIAYYLGQRIDNLPVSGNDKPFNTKSDIIPAYTTTQLTWWERRGLPEWMIRDISDEGRYGQITRPTIPEDIDPISDPHPRRIVVILFGLLHRIPTTNTSDRKIPVWAFSPLYAALQALYRKFN